MSGIKECVRTYVQNPLQFHVGYKFVMPFLPDEQVPIFQNVALFERLSTDVRKSLLSLGERRVYERGVLLFDVGDVCQGLHLVISGQVKLVAKSNQGHEKVMEVIEAGHCLTDGWSPHQMHHTVSAQAMTEVAAFCLPQRVMQAAFMSEPQMAINLIQEMSDRYMALMRRIEAMNLHSGSRRVVDYLLRQGAIHVNVKRHADQPAIALRQALVSLPASKGTIASLLSVTPEHFSRILHDLQAQGLIQVQRRDIHIPDIDRLLAFE